MHDPITFNTAKIERKSTHSTMTIRATRKQLRPIDQIKEPDFPPSGVVVTGEGMKFGLGYIDLELTVHQWEKYIKLNFHGWTLILCGDDIGE